MLTERDHPLELTMLAEDVDKVVLEAQLFSADEGPIRRDISPEKYLYVNFMKTTCIRGRTTFQRLSGKRGVQARSTREPCW